MFGVEDPVASVEESAATGGMKVVVFGALDSGCARNPGKVCPKNPDDLAERLREFYSR